MNRTYIEWLDYYENATKEDVIVEMMLHINSIKELRKDITNLQEELKELRIDYSMVVAEDKKLKEENEILKENAIHNDKVVDNAKWNEMIYKSRINKANEYCELNKEYTPRLIDVANILKGSD